MPVLASVIKVTGILFVLCSRLMDESPFAKVAFGGGLRQRLCRYGFIFC
jgi:hypothetical protein